MNRYAITISNDNGPETDEDRMTSTFDEACEYAKFVASGYDPAFPWANAARVYADATPNEPFATFNYQYDAEASYSTR